MRRMIPFSALFLTDPIRFPVDNYTEKNVTVNTLSGEVEVTYRLYEHITYVANPVDTDYQSMNVKVPIKVNGKDVDATNAPILFVNSVGGYLSASVASGGMSGALNGNMNGIPPAV